MDILEQGLAKWSALDQGKKSRACFFGAGVSLGLFAVILVFHIAHSTTEASAPRRTVVVSTDGGPDDLMALHYLLRRGDTSVPLVIAAGNGQGSPAATYANVKAALRVAQADGAQSAASVVVAVGGPDAVIDRKARGGVAFGPRETPIGRDATCAYRRVVPSADSLRRDTLFGAAQLLRTAASTTIASRRREAKAAAGSGASPGQPPYFAAELERLLTAAEPGSVSLLVLSPMTDVATFFDHRPGLAARLRDVVVAGGAVAEGTVQLAYPHNTRAEMNVFLDPTAADVFLRRVAGETGDAGGTRPRVTVLPHDVAARVPMSGDAATWRALTADTTATLPGVLGAALRGYYESVVPHSLFAARAHALDVVAALALVAPVVRSTLRAVPAPLGVLRPDSGAANGTALPTLATVGTLGAVEGRRPVDLVTSIDPAAVWPEYLRTTRLPYP